MLFPILAGLFGASSSYLSKLLSNILQHLLDETNTKAKIVSIPLLVVGVVATNVAMWYCFSFSLKTSRNTVTATGLNLASNFLISVHSLLFNNDL